MSAEGDGERAKLAAEFAVFREDVVRSVAGDALLGVVEGVGGHSDSEEDDQEYEELAKGSARVSWYKKADNPATVAVDSLEVVDRALLHHDVVARKSAPLGQAGYVTAVDVKCTVRFLATGEVMEGVDSRLLQQVQPLKQGTYVVYGHWLGKVDEAMDHVTVRMQDGSVCRVANADPELLVPQHDEGFNEESPYYYPGQLVKGNQGVLMRANWLKGGPKHGVKEGTVVSVEPGRAVVRWVAANQMQTADAAQPMEVVDGRKLQVLEAFAHTWWQLGDMAILDPDASLKRDGSTAHEEAGSEAGVRQGADAGTDTAADLPDDARAQAADTDGGATGSAQVAARRRPAAARVARGGGRVRTSGSKDAAGTVRRKGALRDDCAKCVEIICTSTSVEVTWQDGSIEPGVCTIDLVPVKHMGAHDFFPEEYVVEKLDDGPLDARDAPPQAPVPAPPGAPGLAAWAPPVAPASAASAASGEGATSAGSAAQPEDPMEQGGGGAGTGVGADGGPQHMKLPAHLVPTLQAARQQLREELMTSMAPADARHLDQLVAGGNLADTLHFVSSHPQSYSFLQRMLRTPHWQELLRDSQVQELAHELFEKAGIAPPFVGGANYSSLLQRRHRFGILKEIDCSERICKVHWLGICCFDGSREVVGKEAEKEAEGTKGSLEELVLGPAEVSSYELQEHPEYTYSIGDVVMRLQKKDKAWSLQPLDGDGQGDDKAAQGSSVQGSSSDSQDAPNNELEDGWETTSEHTDDSNEAGDADEAQLSDEYAGEEEDDEYDDDVLVAKNQREVQEGRESGKAASRPGGSGAKSRKGLKQAQEPWVGELVSLRDGRLKVQWLTGEVSWVWPSEVLVMSSDVDMWQDDEMDNEEGASDWETVGSDEEAQLPAGDGLDSSDVIEQLNRLSRLARGRRDDVSDGDDDDGEEEEDEESGEDGDTAEDGAPLNAFGARDARDAREGQAEGGKERTRFYAAASIRHVWSAVGGAVGGALGLNSLLRPRSGKAAADAADAASAPGESETGGAGEGGGGVGDGAGAAVGAGEGARREGRQVHRLGMGAEEGVLQNAGADAGADRQEQRDPARDLRALRSSLLGLEHGRGDAHMQRVAEREGVVPSLGSAMASPAAHSPALVPPAGGVVGGADEEDEDEEEADDEEEEGAFEVAASLPGHRFDSPAGHTANPPSQELVKRVRKEWKSLRCGLPKGIYVRASEERMDMMRAVILGPAKTPYADGFFVFDIFLPPEYPNVAPQVLFISYGDRLNPNLYDNGKVCLSLLGTWGGDSVETWNASTSTILQVLVSIQGLVLVSEPYYNEAGYEKQMGTLEGRHNSKQYNESTLLLVLKHMIYSLTHPTPPLEGLIRDHFRRRAPAIIRRCQRILEKTSSLAAPAACAGVTCSSSPGTCSSSPAAAGAGSGEGRGASASAAGAGDTHASQERMEEGDGGDAAGDAVGWADRSVPESASKGFLRSLEKLLPRLKAVLPA